jgi:ribonuclease HI
MMNRIMLFSDGSVDVHSGIGFGAYLAVTEQELLQETLKKQVQVKRFEQTSSVRLELQALLWGLKCVPAGGNRIVIYTDSQAIVGLPGRRSRLEKRDYYSKNNRRIKNHEIYREFFRITSLIDCEFIKVRGHQPSHRKDNIHRLFSLVDRASRNALRKAMR